MSAAIAIPTTTTTTRGSGVVASTCEILDHADEFFASLPTPTLVFLRFNTKPLDCMTNTGERVVAYTLHCWHDECGETELILEYFSHDAPLPTERLQVYELYMYAAIMLFKYGFRRAPTYELTDYPTIKAFTREHVAV